MLKAVIELSNYILIINMLLYVLISFILIPFEDGRRKHFALIIQNVLIFINHLTGSLVLLSVEMDISYLFLMLFQMIVVFSFLVLMRAIYPKTNRLILNHTAMLLSISFVILTRLSLTRSIRQFAIVAVSLIVALVIPLISKYIQLLRKFRYLFAGIGILILAAVLITGSITNGSKLSFSIMGISFQPSEFIKMLYVLFIAGMLYRAEKFRNIFLSAVLAAAHVLILVASRDLGSALIFYTVYIVLLYIATSEKRYMILGLAGAAVASYMAYLLFSHVQIRVSAWLDPWSDVNNTGYQIAQSLFAIGTGGWFGMGVGGGMPQTIPYVEKDFIFSAICEEFGVIYGICVILICLNLFLEIAHIAYSCKDRFIKLASYGLGVTYIFQLFLTIGGNIKFIPSTGVTFPLISYGGSSVLATLMMISLVQSFYQEHRTLFEVEVEEDEYIEVKNHAWQINIISGAFVCLFTAMSVYLAHYIYFDSVKVINNTYNAKRQEVLASKTIRGDILAADGSILATTIKDDNGEKRYYPYSDIFAHAVGYSENGRMGVEQSANIYLVSSDISLNQKVQDNLDDVKHMGNTVYTTFDTDLQKTAYNALGIYDGAIIVTDPTTGKILAMVSKPDFDPNTIVENWEAIIQDEESSILVNRVSQGLYPPGSTFKILTALEYIRENPDDYTDYTFDCSGSFTSDDSTIRCYHGTKHGSINFRTSFAKSCNSSFANMGLELNRNDFADTLEKLLFNQDLPVDLVSNKSKINISEKTTESNMIQAAIGQGSTQMTPLHLSMITSMIANNGEMMIPYTIDHIETANGTTIKQFEPKSLGQLITEEEAAALKELMIAVVEEGTGTRLQGQNYKAAGKTGSAEYSNSTSESHAWFTAFSYDTNTPIQVTVIVEGGGSGGEYAVPIARQIFDEYYAK